MIDRKIAGDIANDAIGRLRKRGLDCVSGGYEDASGLIHDAIFYSVLDAIDRINADAAPAANLAEMGRCNDV